jgi:hypothetical protein
VTAAEELDGATTLPPEWAQIGNAGEFAAVWNSRTPAEREAWIQRWGSVADTASRCVMQNHDGMYHQLALASAKFFRLADLVDSGTHGRELRRKLRRILLGHVR